MRITNNDVVLSNGTSVRELVTNLGTSMTMVLSVRNGRARLALPDEYYAKGQSNAELAKRVADGMTCFGATIHKILEACPEDVEAISPRTYRRMADGSNKSSFAIWFNPDQGSSVNTGTATIDDQLAALTAEYLELGGVGLNKLHGQAPVAVGQLRNWIQVIKARAIEEAADQVENAEVEGEQVSVENL